MASRTSQFTLRTIDWTMLVWSYLFPKSWISGTYVPQPQSIAAATTGAAAPKILRKTHPQHVLSPQNHCGCARIVLPVNNLHQSRVPVTMRFHNNSRSLAANAFGQPGKIVEDV